MDIKRDLEPKLLEYLSDPEIILLTGARQVGKTTLLRKISRDLVDQGEKVIFLNLDIETDAQHFASQERLIQKIKLELGSDSGYVFIDEIQRKENAGLFLKGLYDLELPYKFIVSGSGSLELKEKIHESLAGRKRIFELGPVSFKEFFEYKTDYKYALKEYAQVEKEKLQLFLEEYLNFGGYPRVILAETLEEKQRTIDEIYKSYLEKDIAYLLNLRKVDALAKLIKILAAQVGQMLRYNKLAELTGLDVATVKNYLWYLEKTFVTHELTPYFGNKAKEITKSPVLYFNDLGLRNYVIGEFGNLSYREETSFVFQNFIHNILRSQIQWTSQSLHYWRTLDKAEVDFVLDDGKKLLPIEVKYSSYTKEAIPKSLRSFVDNYNPEQAWIVNLDFAIESKEKDTIYRVLPYTSLVFSS